MESINTAAALTNLLDIKIDKTLPVDVKILEFVRQTDPYHFRVNEMNVTAAFDNNAPPLADAYNRLRA